MERIQRWLNATEANTEQLSPAMPPVNDERATNDRAVKRCRLNPAIIRPPSCNTRPKSPGDMVSPTLSGNLSKRPFDDETPCVRRVQTSTSERSYSSDHSASSSRRAGRTASLQKQLRLLQLNPRGLDVRDMYDVKYTKARPQTLQTLLGDIDAFSDGHGIVAKDAQHALEKAAGSDSRFSWALRPGALHVSHEKDLAGRTPPPGAVRKVMNAAAECSTKQHPAANWNLEVHQRILDMAFRPTEESEFVNLIDFMGTTTASIIPEYGISTLSKKAHFCVYIEPENDPSLSPTFRAGASYARTAMPQGVLNFTDLAALYDRFIALSIKTKKPSEDFLAAQLQLGVWDMARWAFLRRLAELRSDTGTIDTTGANANYASEVKLPEFLPGITVKGHDWFLVITTMEGDKTVLWQNVAIGSTSKSRGVYQIVRTLQYLEKWAKDVHWPWLRAIIEGIPGADASSGQVIC